MDAGIIHCFLVTDDSEQCISIKALNMITYSVHVHGHHWRFYLSWCWAIGFHRSKSVCLCVRSPGWRKSQPLHV